MTPPEVKRKWSDVTVSEWNSGICGWDTHAYIPAANAMADLNEEAATRRLSNNVHSIAEIVAHMAFWQTWFLKRCRGEAEPMAGAPGSGMAAHGHGEWEAIRRNAHHLDQVIRLRQIMGTWPPPSGSWTW